MLKLSNHPRDLVAQSTEDLKALFEQRITVVKENGISRIENRGQA